VLLLLYAPSLELASVRQILQAIAVNLVLLVILVLNAKHAPLDAANAMTVLLELEHAVHHRSQPMHPPTATVQTVSAALVEPAPVLPDGSHLPLQETLPNAVPATLVSSRTLLETAKSAERVVPDAKTRLEIALNATLDSPSTLSNLKYAVSLNNAPTVNSRVGQDAPSVTPLVQRVVDLLLPIASSVLLDPSSSMERVWGFLPFLLVVFAPVAVLLPILSRACAIRAPLGVHLVSMMCLVQALSTQTSSAQSARLASF